MPDTTEMGASGAYPRTCQQSSHSSVSSVRTPPVQPSIVQRGLRRQLDVPKGRQLYLQRTPAMTIGLTDHVWKVRDWLSQPQGVSCRA